MLLATTTFAKLKSWIRLNKNISGTVRHRLAPSFKRFAQSLTKEEQLELIYDDWVDRELELTENGYKALMRMAELLGN